MTFKATGAGNYILETEDRKHFFVSYNPRPLIGGGDGEETALVVLDDNGRAHYLILRGDHREAYIAAVVKDGLGACLRYFQEHERSYRSPWSSGSIDIEGMLRSLSLDREGNS